MSDDSTREPRSTTSEDLSHRRSSAASGRRAGTDEPTPNTALNALVGGVVTVGTALIVPFSPVLGGAVAGYLEGTDSDAGLKAGTLAGLVAMVPMLLVVLLGVAVVPVVGTGGGSRSSWWRCSSSCSSGATPSGSALSAASSARTSSGSCDRCGLPGTRPVGGRSDDHSPSTIAPSWNARRRSPST